MKAGQKVFKYIKADNEMSYGLDEEVSVVLLGDGVAYVGTTLVPREYTTKDGSLTIAQTADAIDWGVRLVAHPFPASSHLWNGPDVIANNQYRSMLASLFHDLIWEHGDELAKAWGVSKQDVLRWGDGVLYALWMYASEDSLRGRIEARVAWSVCEFSKGWYHSLKKLLGLHCLAFALLLAGCGTPPDWQVAEISGTNAVLRAMGRRLEDKQENCLSEAKTNKNEAVDAEIVGKTDTLPTTNKSSTVQSAPQPAPPANDRQVKPSADAVDFAALDWCWGGFKGGSAKPVDGVEITALKVTASGLSYKWARGGCEKLGATSREDADHTICALFCKLDGKWEGGKFDWISTSRTSRDLKNIEGAYNGWDKNAVSKASEYAFVIVSADGKKRTNVIKAGR